MSYEQILEAARCQDVRQLNQALNRVCIDVWRCSSPYFSAVTQLASEAALEKNIAAINFLLSQGANVNYVAMGAAQGGHRSYAEELLGRGARIAYVAMGAAQGGQRSYVEELLGRGANINLVAGMVVGGAALNEHRAYAEELLGRGANINCVASNVAQGGHREYAEELLGRGADINWVARGAALGGHRAYAEELIGRGADINNVASNVAQGGHREYAEELLVRGAAITAVAWGAAEGGHRAYAEELIGRGARIYRVAMGAINGEHILNEKVESQIAYLSFFRPDLIPKLISAFRNVQFNIDDDTEKRSIALSKHMRQNKASYASAFTRTDPNCAGMLFLLMKIMMKKNFSSIAFDLWAHIFNFVTPVKLNHQELMTLGFMVGRTYVRVQLSGYLGGWWISSRKAAEKFHEAVILANDKEVLIQLVVEYSQGKEYKKAIENKSEDRFHRIIGFWKKELMGEDAELEKSHLILPTI